MPAKRELTMRQLRQMLRLHHEGLGAREIGRRLGVARGTIQDNLKRAQAAGLAWPLDPDLSDEILEQRLFGRASTKSFRHRAEPDWATLASELKRPGVNLTVLWEEYRDIHPDGYRYSSYVAAKFMLRERPHLAGSLRAGQSLTQHNPMPGVADLVSTEVRHGSEHFSQS